jgi:ATP-dependent Clp protease adaptor protein ClpS
MEDTKTHKLVLYNDKINSYEYIMACLMKFCEHDKTQAEQCSIVAHNNGKCTVKHGDFLEMLELRDTFELVEVKTQIEEYENYMY